MAIRHISLEDVETLILVSKNGEKLSLHDGHGLVLQKLSGHGCLVAVVFVVAVVVVVVVVVVEAVLGQRVMLQLSQSGTSLKSSSSPYLYWT